MTRTIMIAHGSAAVQAARIIAAAAREREESNISTQTSDSPPVAEQQVGDLKVKPLDLSTLLRDAFLAGRGLKDGDRLSGEDQAAWMAYDPERMAAYRRISTALYGRV